MKLNEHFWRGFRKGSIQAFVIWGIAMALWALSLSCHGAEIYAQLKQTPGAQTVEANRPSIRSAPGSISDRFLSALATIESQNRISAVGDSGRARGAFQFHRDAWNDVSALRLLRGTNYYRYDAAMNYAVAREYARERCEWLRARLIVEMDRQPTAGEIYAAYNCGLTRFIIERGCKLLRCPKSTREAVKRLEQLIK